MKNRRKLDEMTTLYPVGSLMAVAEVMLILWVVSIIGITIRPSSLEESPIVEAPASDSRSTFEHAVLIGPGKTLQLNGDVVSLDDLVSQLTGMEGNVVDLRPDPGVDARFFFDARYRLRTAGIGYTEKPPVRENNTQRKDTT